MVDPIAAYAAVTSTVAIGISVRREILASRRRVAVDHGWRYALDEEDPPGLQEMWVYVMARNVGGRDVSVEHAGWEWLVLTETLPDGTRVFEARRAEVPLESPVLLKPDSVPLKITTSIGPLLHLVDPLETEVRPVVFTDGGNTRWEGPVGPLAQRVPEDVRIARLRESFQKLRDTAKPPSDPGRDEKIWLVYPEWAESGPLEGAS